MTWLSTLSLAGFSFVALCLVCALVLAADRPCRDAGFHVHRRSGRKA